MSSFRSPQEETSALICRTPSKFSIFARKSILGPVLSPTTQPWLFPEFQWLWPKPENISDFILGEMLQHSRWTRRSAFPNCCIPSSKFIPMEDLLLARKFSKTWQATIITSKPRRCLLFFESESTDTISRHAPVWRWLQALQLSEFLARKH